MHVAGSRANNASLTKGGRALPRLGAPHQPYLLCRYAHRRYHKMDHASTAKYCQLESLETFLAYAALLRAAIHASNDFTSYVSALDQRPARDR